MIARFGMKRFISQCTRTSSITNNQGYFRNFGSIQRIGLDNPNMSQTVVHNDIVYISGQVDATASDIEGQTKDVLAKVDALLGEAGTDKANLLTASIWVKDIEKDFKGMNSVWNQWLDPDNKPVRATGESVGIFSNDSMSAIFIFSQADVLP